MLNKLLQNKTTVFVLMLLVALLASVRAFEKQLFYDPFLIYFEADYLNWPLPEFNALKLFLSLLFRFTLNSIISLGIIYFLFKEVEMVKFAAFLYVFFFVILTTAYFIIIYFYGENNNLILFYVRRFLIQPLFLILFIPAFYYQKQSK
jgi:exosortase F-associated protein